MKMSIAEIIGGGFIVGFAGWFLNLALKFPAPLNPSDLGSGAFPKLITLIILLLSIVLIIKGIREFRTNPHKIIIKRQSRVMAFIVTLIGYSISMPFLGYYISTAICVVLLLIIAGESKVRTCFLITAGFLLFSLVGFDILLDVPLP